MFYITVFFFFQTNVLISLFTRIYIEWTILFTNEAEESNVGKETLIWKCLKFRAKACDWLKRHRLVGGQGMTLTT